MTGSQADQIRVIMADDQEFVREAFEMLVSVNPTLDLAGVFRDGAQAANMASVLKPDVAILDLKMPVMDGLEASRLIREREPEIGIILLTSYGEPETIREFLRDSPRGKAYLLKHTLNTMDELIRTIHDVAAGRAVIDPLMVQRLTTHKTLVENSPIKELTKRELEVIALMAQACTNNTIASVLHIEPRTVEHHINSIFSKLVISSKNRQHARVKAVLTYLDATQTKPFAPHEPVLQT